jgi:hypothetical protein
VWTADFLTMGSLGGLAGYMFDDQYPLWLRGLSLFHLPLVAVLVWMLWRQGYDKRALWAQTLVAWIVLPLTWWLTDPDENINWVWGLGPHAHGFLSPQLYLVLFMAALPVAVYLPTHLVLKRLFGTPTPARAPDRGPPR